MANLCHIGIKYMIKGSTITEETRQKMSKARMGKKPWNKGLLGYGKGHTVSAEARIKIGNATRGKTPWIKGKKIPEETKRKISEARKGMKFSKEHLKNMSLARKGDKNWNWKGGITPINNAIRNSLEYKLWRKAVYERDNLTCVWCGKKGGWNKNTRERIVINADHIKPFALFPELRFAIDNGRTLCVNCHKTTSTYGVNKTYVK